MLSQGQLGRLGHVSNHLPIKDNFKHSQRPEVKLIALNRLGLVVWSTFVTVLTTVRCRSLGICEIWKARAVVIKDLRL